MPPTITEALVKVQHTSASLMLNENYDPTVRKDYEMALNKIAPEDFPYVHTDEGPDDMVREGSRVTAYPSERNQFLILSLFHVAWTCQIWPCRRFSQYSYNVGTV